MEHPVCDKCRKELDKICWENSVWYGYLHVNGTSHLKRIASTDDWEEAFASDFVRKISRPFVAQGRKAAQEKMEEILVHHERWVKVTEWMASLIAGKTLVGKVESDFSCSHNNLMNTESLMDHGQKD